MVVVVPEDVPGMFAVLLVEAELVRGAVWAEEAGLVTLLVPVPVVLAGAEVEVELLPEEVEAVEEVEEVELLGAPAEIEVAATALALRSAKVGVSAKITLTLSIFTSWTVYPSSGVKPGVGIVKVPCVTGMLFASANWLRNWGLPNCTVISDGSVSRSVACHDTVVEPLICTL